MFWYLLAKAGLIREKADDLAEDTYLREMYAQRFNKVYGLGFVNLAGRPTHDITELKSGDELKGRENIRRIIRKEKPRVVCFVGKVAFSRWSGLRSEDIRFGWQDRIDGSHVFVMHFPLRGKAAVRVRELRQIHKEVLRRR